MAAAATPTAGGNRVAKADRGGNVRVSKADRGGANGRAKADRGGNVRVAKSDRGGNRDARSIQKFANGGDDRKQSRSGRASGFDDRGKNRGRDDNRGIVRVRDRDDNRVVLSSRDLDDRRLRGVRIDGDRFDDDRFDRRIAGLGWADGCPPGLAKKHNGCLPPGQAKKVWGNNVWGLGAVLPATYYSSRVVPTYYRDYNRSRLGNFLLDDDDYYYRYGDGYMYRVDRDRNLIAGLIPLLGGGYSIGQPYPLGYGVYNVPTPIPDLLRRQ